MSIPLITFFVSLLGIIFMVGRKLLLIQSGIIVNAEDQHTFVPDVETIKEVFTSNAKKHSYAALVVLIRLYVQFSNLLKRSLSKTKSLLVRKFSKKASPEDMPEKQEVSKFLKLVSAYKLKIRKIKRKIVVEEEKKDKIKI
jgi:hypothetical protein